MYAGSSGSTLVQECSKERDSDKDRAIDIQCSSEGGERRRAKESESKERRTINHRNKSRDISLSDSGLESE